MPLIVCIISKSAFGVSDYRYLLLSERFKAAESLELERKGYRENKLDFSVVACWLIRLGQ